MTTDNQIYYHDLHLIYRDTGCPDGMLPSCLNCSLSRCRFDLPHKRAGSELREQRLAVLLAQGLSMAAAAAELGVSTRTAFRLQHRLAGPLKASPHASPVPEAGITRQSALTAR